MKYEVAGDPVSGLRWTRKTTKKIAAELSAFQCLAAPRYQVLVRLECGTAGETGSPPNFFGLGVQPPEPSLGNLLYGAQASLAPEPSNEPWLAVFPGLFIFGIVLGVNLLGDGMRGVTRARAD